MSEVQNQTKRNVRIFGCGGGGTNIAYSLERMRSRSDRGFAAVDITYLDASKSNLRSNIPAKSIYLIDGLDGSGKVRSENHVEISDRIKEILQQFKPADLTIVISTFAGGTGSVIAPLLAKELLAREAPVIFIGVGDTTTRLDTVNTLRTIQSFESFAKDADAPVVLKYFRNSEELTRAAIDKQIGAVVESLCALFSGENRELDSRDLFNWLRFSNPKVTTFPSQLVTLHNLVGGDIDVSGLGNVISVASLLAEGQSFSLPTRPEYATWGYLPAGIEPNVLSAAPYHFVIADAMIPHEVEELKNVLVTLSDEQSARRSRRNILDGAGHQDGTGLIL